MSEMRKRSGTKASQHQTHRKATAGERKLKHRWQVGQRGQLPKVRMGRTLDDLDDQRSWMDW